MSIYNLLINCYTGYFQHGFAKPTFFRLAKPYFAANFL